MYEIIFVAQVLEGLKDAESGKLLTTEELLNRVEQWELQLKKKKYRKGEKYCLKRYDAGMP